MTTELKPCPFCGDEEPVIEQYGDNRVSTVYQCHNCGYSLSTGETFNHGAAWNTRATPDVPELETVALTDQDELDMCAEGYATSIWKAPIHDDGKPQIELVRKDQAAAMIADKVKIGEQVADKIFADYTTQLLLKEDAIKRAQYAETELAKSILKVNALETKLAHINDQKPVSLGWIVRERRDGSGNLLDCFVEAPMVAGMAYGLEVLGDDYTGYGDVEGKFEHCKLIVSLVNAAPVASDAETIERLQSAGRSLIATIDVDNDLDSPEKFNAYCDFQSALSGKEPS